MIRLKSENRSDSAKDAVSYSLFSLQSNGNQHVQAFSALGLQVQTWLRRFLGPRILHVQYEDRRVHAEGMLNLCLLSKVPVCTKCFILVCVCGGGVSHSVVSNSVTPWTVAHARILEWVAIPFSKGSSQPWDWTRVSCIAGRFFTIWATG